MKFWWKNPRNQFLSKPNCKTFCFNILRLKSEFETSGSIPLDVNVFLSLFVDLSVHWIKHFSKFVWFKLVPVLWLCLLHYSSVWRYCFKYIKCSYKWFLPTSMNILGSLFASVCTHGSIYFSNCELLRDWTGCWSDGKILWKIQSLDFIIYVSFVHDFRTIEFMRVLFVAIGTLCPLKIKPNTWFLCIMLNMLRLSRLAASLHSIWPHAFQ